MSGFCRLTFPDIVIIRESAKGICDKTFTTAGRFSILDQAPLFR